MPVARLAVYSCQHRVRKHRLVLSSSRGSTGPPKVARARICSGLVFVDVCNEAATPARRPQ